MNCGDVIQNWSDEEIKEVTSRIKIVKIEEDKEELPF